MAASNIARIILAAVSGLMGGWANSRQALQDRKLKEKELQDKREDRLAEANKASSAMQMFNEFQKLKQAGARPEDLMAYASFGKGGSPLLYQIDPGTFVGSNRARATGTFKGATGIPDSAFGIGGAAPSGGGRRRPAVRSPGPTAPPATGPQNMADLQAKARAALAKRQGGG